ncbi:MAG: peptide deformylase [Candidatus Omnitrophota bacterium]|jgi:peptide deformylase
MKPLLKMRYCGNVCLRKKSEPVQEVGPSERLLIEAMIEKLHDEKGVGLAAPQVGINQQIFVVDIGLGPVVVINPKIIKRTGSEWEEEGCLSVPGVTVKVKRPKEIRVRYMDENNQEVEQDLAELMARVFMHENDHLNGKLIIDYASWRERGRLKKKLEKLPEKEA